MRFGAFVSTIILGFAIVLGVMNKSVYAYIEQKYHLAAFDPENPILYALATPARYLDALRLALLPSKEELALMPSKDGVKDSAPDGQKDSLKDARELESMQDSPSEPPPPQYPLITEGGQLVLEEGSTFLFIGDSLMQGVGLTLGRELRQRGFQVIDLARQSTGLTYVDFFDWGQTLQDAFKRNPHIKVVVIMVGANDPHNMPKIPYATKEWIEIYEGRIHAILEIANAHNAVVVWYEVPVVKKPSLNAKLTLLNTLYARQVEEARAIFLHSNEVLAPSGDYSTYSRTAEGKSVKLRASDGIHFSTEGSKALSALLLARLEVVESLGHRWAVVDSVDSREELGGESRAGILGESQGERQGGARDSQGDSLGFGGGLEGAEPRGAGARAGGYQGLGAEGAEVERTAREGGFRGAIDSHAQEARARKERETKESAQEDRGQKKRAKKERHSPAPYSTSAPSAPHSTPAPAPASPPSRTPAPKPPADTPPTSPVPTPPALEEFDIEQSAGAHHFFPYTRKYD